MPLYFYIFIQLKTVPVLKKKAIATPATQSAAAVTKRLYLDAGERYDLKRLFEGAESDIAPSLTFAFRSGYTPPTGLSLSGQSLVIGDAVTSIADAVELTATNATGSTNVDVLIVVVLALSPILAGNAYKVLIEGIDVSDDLIEKFIPDIHFSLDTLRPYEYISDDVIFRLSSDRGKYDGRVAGNFWDTHNLNPNGYLTAVEIWTEAPEILLFKGRIKDIHSDISDISVQVQCTDESDFLKNLDVFEEGLPKYSVVARDESLNRVQQVYPLQEHIEEGIKSRS